MVVITGTKEKGRWGKTGQWDTKLWRPRNSRVQCDIDGKRTTNDINVYNVFNKNQEGIKNFN